MNGVDEIQVHNDMFTSLTTRLSGGTVGAKKKQAMRTIINHLMLCNAAVFASCIKFSNSVI